MNKVGDLISRAALLKECEERQKSDPLEDGRGWADHFLNDAQCPSTEWNSVEEMIEYMPAVDATPAKHGRWIETAIPANTTGHGGVGQDKKKGWLCSGCRCAFDAELLWIKNYCPGCGAKMGLEELDAKESN